MRNKRLLIISVTLLFTLACSCGALSNIPNLKSIASTQLPGFLTSVPTTQGIIETAAAQQSSTCTGTPSAGGLGVALDRAKSVLQATQQFTFTDGTVDGLPASTATLSGGASDYSAIAKDFSAQFIGDPCNLSRILVKAPYTSDQATIDEGLAAANILLTAVIPLDVQLQLVSWLAQNYSSVPVGGQQQTTIGKMQFTLSRTQTEMTLEIVPAP